MRVRCLEPDARDADELMATSAAKHLTDEQLAQALALAHESDSVELKFTVPDSHRRLAVTALEMDPLDSQVRLVYFFDTPDLALDRSGLVVVRARRVQGRGDDSVVKLRPVVPGELPASVRQIEKRRGRARRAARRIRVLGVDEARHGSECRRRNDAR